MYKPKGAALVYRIAPLWGYVANTVRLVLPDFPLLNLTPMGFPRPQLPSKRNNTAKEAKKKGWLYGGYGDKR